MFVVYMHVSVMMCCMHHKMDSRRTAVCSRKVHGVTLKGLSQWLQVLCIQGFLACRKHADRIILLVEMMQGSGCPAFKAGPRCVQNLRKRFHLGLTETQACTLFLAASMQYCESTSFASSRGLACKQLGACIAQAAMNLNSTSCHGYVPHGKECSVSFLELLVCCMPSCLYRSFCVSLASILVIVHVQNLICVLAVCGSSAGDDQ